MPAQQGEQVDLRSGKQRWTLGHIKIAWSEKSGQCSACLLLFSLQDERDV